MSTLKVLATWAKLEKYGLCWTLLRLQTSNNSITPMFGPWTVLFCTDPLGGCLNLMCPKPNSRYTLPYLPLLHLLLHHLVLCKFSSISPSFQLLRAKTLALFLTSFSILCLVHFFFLSVLSNTYIKSDYFLPFILVQAFIIPVCIFIVAF